MIKKYQIKEFSPIAPPYGGVSVYLRRLIESLNKDGFSAGGYYTHENQELEIRESPLFELFDWNASWSKLRKLYSHIRRIILASRQYDIIHIHGQELICLPALVHLLKGQKIVITVHNAMIGNYFQRMSRLNRWGFKYLAESNVQWVAVSEEAKEQLLGLPVRYTNPISIIPAYIPDQTALLPLPGALSLYISQHEKIISFYGRSFMTYNNHDVYGFIPAIKAYKSIRDNSQMSVGLVMCVSDSSNISGLNELHRYAEEMGVDNDIYWLVGGIKGIRALWAATDVYVRPTYTDGDSVSVRDAMAEGAVVVASNVCLRPEGVLIYQYGDDNDFVEKIKIAMEDNNTQSFGMEYYEEMKRIYNLTLAQK